MKTLNLNNENLYNIADTKTKKMIDTYVEEWRTQGLLKDNSYFSILAKNIYSRTRVKNSEILELLIYGTYIEEQGKLDKYEQQIMYDDMNYYYEQGQGEVLKANKKKDKSSILDMALFLYLLDQPLYNGYTFKRNIEVMLRYNSEQIYKQCLINIMQGRENDIEDSIFQNLIKRQNNQKLCINNDKISGSMDLTLIGLNNLSKVEGIKEQDSNAKVRFIAVIDGKETEMCHSLDGQEFYIDKENVFDRYYGETQAELRIERIKCKGLVLGLNLPPISHHFHWCRSTIIYLAPVKEKQIDKKYNLFSSKEEKYIEERYNINKVRIKGIDKEVLDNILNNMERVYDDFPQIKGKIKKIKAIEHPNGGMNIQPDLKDNKYVIEINKKFFGDKEIVEKQYKEDVKNRFHPKGTKYEDLGIHELGHSVTFEIIKNKYRNRDNIINNWNKDITAKQIVNKAFTNLGVNDKLARTMLRNNISIYAKTKHSETIGEAFADYYANKEKANILSKEIIKVMKGMI